MKRHAIWFTLFASTVLLLLFYHEFILSTSQHKDPYLPVSDYFSMERLPLWNTTINSGMPIWGNPENISNINFFDSAFFSLLKFLQPYVPDIHFLYLLLNLLLFSGFMFAFMRKLGIRPPAASYVTVLVLFIPEVVINIVDDSWTNILALCLTPAILYFTLLLLEQRKLLWFALGSFFLTFQLLRASAAVTFFTLVLILVLYIVYSLHWRVKSKVHAFMSRGVLCLAMIGFSFTLAAYVYLPFLEFINYVIINEAQVPLSLKDLLQYVYPSFNGHFVHPESRFILYFGVIVMFLAGFAILLRRNWRTFLLLSSSLACLATSFSGYWGPAIYSTPFIFLVLAGIGLNALMKYRYKARKRKRARWLDIYMLIVWGIFSAGFMIFLFNKPGYMHHILRQLPLLTLSAQNVYYKKVLLEGAAAFVFIGLSFLIIRLYINERIHLGIFVASILVLSLCDLLIVDYKLVAIREKKAPELPKAVLAELQQNREPFRIFSTTDFSLQDYQSVLGESKSVLKTYYAFLNHTGFNEIDVQGMRNPFFSKYTRLVTRGDNIVEEPIPVDYIDPVRLEFDRSILDMLNVKYIISQSPIHDANYLSIHDSSFFVYKNTSGLPRAFFVDSVFVLPGRRAIFDAMQTENYNPRQLAFLEQEPPFQVNKSDSNTVDIRSYQNGRLIIDVDVQEPSVLVLSEVYYPAGWRAFVDHKRTKLYKTNYFLKSVFLSPGRHQIRIEFQPTLFRIGIIISLVSAGFWMVAFIAGLVFYYKKRRTQNMVK